MSHFAKVRDGVVIQVLVAEQEFFDIASSHTVSPWRLNIFEQESGTKLPDFESWTRDGKMKREDAEKQLENWKRSQ